MFYTTLVLGKKNPLARVWLAAHWDKKITKAQILETNIVESVDSILQQNVELSLRTSSHLMLGIVRIYARKTLYLLQDCQDAAFRMNSSFKIVSVVDLPNRKNKVAIGAITLPETFDFVNNFDIMAEPQLHLEPTTTANIRSITLAEDISSTQAHDPLLMNEVRDWSEIGSIGGGSFNIKDGGDSTLYDDSGIFTKNDSDLFGKSALDDGFGGQLGVGIMDEDDTFGMQISNDEEVQQNNDLGHISDEHGDDNDHEVFTSRPNSPMSIASGSYEEHVSAPPSVPGSPQLTFNSNIDLSEHLHHNSVIAENDSTQNQNEEVSQNTLVLEPINSQLGGLVKRSRKRRKNDHIAIDEKKTLSSDKMKAQLTDTSDIVASLDLAPPSRMFMNMKKNGSIDQLFSRPEKSISTQILSQYYSRNLKTVSQPDIGKQNEPSDVDTLLLNQDEATEPDSPVPPRKKRKIQENAKKNKKTAKKPRKSEYEKLDDSLTELQDFQQDQSSFLDNSIPIEEARLIHDEQNSSMVCDIHISDVEPNMLDKSAEKESEEEDLAVWFMPEMQEMSPDQEGIKEKRSKILLKHISAQLKETNELNFTSLLRNNKRKLVAQKFYAILVLKKQQAIQLRQDLTVPYSELFIEKGEKYEEGLLTII